MADVVVLCYHAVSPSWPSALAVTPQSLEEQIRHLLARGYRPRRFTEAVLDRPREDTFAVTFDDGYRSVYDLALPLMRSLQVPGTLFVTTSFIGSDRPMSWAGITEWLDGEHAAELLPVDWGQLEELRDAGWEIGSHTRTHPHLTELGDAPLREELEGARRDLAARLGSCTSIAYPYGDVDARVARAAGAAGYSVGGTLPEHFPLRPRPLLWPRVGVYGYQGASEFRRHASRPMRLVRATPAWGAVRVLLPPLKAAAGRVAARRGRAPAP